MSKMVLALVSGGMEKLTAGGIMLSGAIAQDMDVKVFLLLGGAYAFRKGTAENIREVGDFQNTKDQFLAGLQKANVPYWLDFYKKAKEMGKVTFYLCGTAGKIWGSDKLEDYVDIVDTVCGIGEYITAAEEADLNITLFTRAELVSKSGAVGDFQVKVRAGGEDISLHVGAIIVLTGFDVYEPRPGEFGYGASGILTLPEFKDLVESSAGSLEYGNRPIRAVSYIYCVGSRQGAGAGEQTPTAPGTAAMPPFTPRSSRPRRPRPSTSFISTGISGATASSNCSTRRPAARGRFSSASAMTIRRGSRAGTAGGGLRLRTC